MYLAPKKSRPVSASRSLPVLRDRMPSRRTSSSIPDALFGLTWRTSDACRPKRLETPDASFQLHRRRSPDAGFEWRGPSPWSPILRPMLPRREAPFPSSWRASSPVARSGPGRERASGGAVSWTARTVAYRRIERERERLKS